LAGIYGMNFEYIPELKFRYGYFILLGVMSVISVGLIVLFKRKRWL
jgi:magnesium transporter